MIHRLAGGDLRFVPMLIEDSVTGSGSGYDQVNYYSSAHSSGGVGGASHLIIMTQHQLWVTCTTMS